MENGMPTVAGGKGGVYLAPLTRHDGLENPESNIPDREVPARPPAVLRRALAVSVRMRQTVAHDKLRPCLAQLRTGDSCRGMRAPEAFIGAIDSKTGNSQQADQAQHE